MSNESWIAADWPAPKHVHAGTTTRQGGVSLQPYSSFNLARHVDDDNEKVEVNRQKLKSLLDLPSEPHWLNQVHGCNVSTDAAELTEADASMTSIKGRVCVVMTADCLPVLITDKKGSCVAAVHAGWRGLEQRAIVKTIESMPIVPEETLVWLGPAIGPQFFEVGDDVRDLFLIQDNKYAQAFVAVQQSGKWLMDVYHVARQQLLEMNITQVYGGQFCTYQEEQRFFSYRRENITGRMASLIWMT